MSFLSILGVAVLVVLVVFSFAFLLVGLQCFIFFHWRSCKHCGHTMDYKGRKEEDDDNSYYLFRCPECGDWEKVPREEFFRQCDNPINEN